jgi:two-component system, NtrC family, response regulator AtoC
VFATNRELEREIDEGRFRRDLFFRINGASLFLPPLRERTSEIEALARAFLRARAPSARLSDAALRDLQRYEFPGNVRELKNMLERAAVLSGGGVVEPQHLRFSTRLSVPTASVAVTLPPPPPATASGPGERERILMALQECAGNQTKAAEKLGISRRTLVNRLNELDIPRPRKR